MQLLYILDPITYGSSLSTLAMSSPSLPQIAVIVLTLLFLSPNLTVLYSEVKRSLKNIHLLKMFLCSLVGQTYWIKTRYHNVANMACPDLTTASFYKLISLNPRSIPMKKLNWTEQFYDWQSLHSSTA